MFKIKSVKNLCQTLFRYFKHLMANNITKKKGSIKNRPEKQFVSPTVSLRSLLQEKFIHVTRFIIHLKTFVFSTQVLFIYFSCFFQKDSIKCLCNFHGIIVYSTIKTTTPTFYIKYIKSNNSNKKKINHNKSNNNNFIYVMGYILFLLLLLVLIPYLLKKEELIHSLQKNEEEKVKRIKTKRNKNKLWPNTIN